ncbi:MAG: division plane positioning ATPase MipZ [Parcubacteria group bacterium]
MNSRWWSFGRDRTPPPRPSGLWPAAPAAPLQRLSAPKVVVIGNEKGGAGKTTFASLISVAMLYRGARVAAIDLDLRQSSLGRFLANRRRWVQSAGAHAPMPLEFKLSENTDELSRTAPAGIIGLFEEAITLAMRNADIVVIDTPGGDTPVSRAAHLQADVVVTPMNDSFVDFDVLGVVDPLTLDLVRPSHYARVVHDARRTRTVYGRQLDWVVMPNRLAPTEARNRERLQRDLQALARQVGFRIGPSLSERVIYRELFPFGLTIADLSPQIKPIKVTAPREAVKSEMQALLEAVGLANIAFDRAPFQPHPGLHPR